MRFKKFVLAGSIVMLIVVLSAAFSGCSFLTLPEPQMVEASKIYDSQNRLITSLFKENRIQISIEQIPQVTQDAFIAVEDARFYRHFGLDPIRILSAVWNNVKERSLAEGGSTITQQTAKNLYLTREKTFGRKLIEAWLAIQLEIKYEKKEILEIYLNQNYFGHGAYGIEVAAKTYFNKQASELNLAESAMLAGLLKAPTTYSPFANWEGAKKRQQIVLNRMVETEFISSEEAEKAAKEKLVLKTGGTKTGLAPHFITEVINYITDKYENGANMLFTEGIEVYTTLDLEMQKSAETAFTKGMAGQNKDLDGALVAIDPANGFVRAMVGGRDFTKSKFNRAMQANRQPGSAFKPFLFAAAIDRGYTQGSILNCEPVEFSQGSGAPYKPTDYGSNPYHYRPFTLKEALAASDNVVAVRLAEEVGPENIAEYARRMGVQSDLRPYLSLALGTSEVTPLELTAAYSTLAAQGLKTKPQLILKITDRDDKVIEENIQVAEQVLPETTAFLVTDMLRGVLEPGGTAANVSPIISRPAAGKTGTTQNYRDAWFVGYTPDLVTGVYIGYDSANRSVGASGGTIAAPIWANFMAEALKGKDPTDFNVPQGIIKVSICADSGQLATPFSPRTLTAYFVAGSEPTEFCSIHSYPSFEDSNFGEESPGPQNGSSGLRRRIWDWFRRP